jgi:hypothetical protein
VHLYMTYLIFFIITFISYICNDVMHQPPIYLKYQMDQYLTEVG